MAGATWTEDEARAFLAGMRTVATVHETRPLTAIAEEMLGAVQRHVLHSQIDLTALSSPSPRRLAEWIETPIRRQEFLQFLILIPYLPMEVDTAQVAVVDEIAAALELEPDTLIDLHRVRDDRLKRLVLDMSRLGLAELTGADGPWQQLKAIAESVHQFAGDKQVADRYRRLEAFPEESLGRTLFQFYRARNFPLPGEKKSLSDQVITHDCCHILGGFNTDMNGEINVAGFEAGLFKNGYGFELLLEVILDFHMGKTFTTAGLLPAGTGHFDPEDVLTGYERGRACKVNLMRDWDFWAAADQPVRELRAQYGLPNSPGPVLLTPPSV
jgi:hypothetical protein